MELLSEMEEKLDAMIAQMNESQLRKIIKAEISRDVEILSALVKEGDKLISEFLIHRAIYGITSSSVKKNKPRPELN